MSHFSSIDELEAMNDYSNLHGQQLMNQEISLHKQQKMEDLLRSEQEKGIQRKKEAVS